jgi:hypothetical protein
MNETRFRLGKSDDGTSFPGRRASREPLRSHWRPTETHSI